MADVGQGQRLRAVASFGTPGSQRRFQAHALFGLGSEIVAGSAVTEPGARKNAKNARVKNRFFMLRTLKPFGAVELPIRRVVQADDYETETLA